MHLHRPWQEHRTLGPVAAPSRSQVSQALLMGLREGSVSFGRFKAPTPENGMAPCLGWPRTHPGGRESHPQLLTSSGRQ